MPGPLVAVDAPFLLYRSFFALPQSITGVEDRPVGSLLGAVNVLLRVAADRDPRTIVVCFGQESATYRTELYPPYHADRPPVPDALAWQFARAPALFEAFGWPTEHSPDLEADDLLGALATAEAAAGGRTLILTGDRDMYQCVDAHTHVLYLKAAKIGFEEVDPEEVRLRYGVGPELVPDFIALRGDPSDSLPGAPGVGPKTASELLRTHGSLEGVIAAVRELRPKLAATIRECAEDLRRYREIATLRPVSLERPPDAPTDLASGAAAARELGLRRLAERLEAAGSPGEL